MENYYLHKWLPLTLPDLSHVISMAKGSVFFPEVLREDGDFMLVVFIEIRRYASSSKQTGWALSPLPHLFIVPHPILHMGEKRICYVSRLSVDLFPDAHLHNEMLTFANETPACWKSPNGPPERRWQLSWTHQYTFWSGPWHALLNMVYLSQRWILTADIGCQPWTTWGTEVKMWKHLS